ncbi:MAG: transposase family protein, partial [Bacteroidota bacterium]
MKSDTQKPKGLLKPLAIPSAKWEQVTTDLVTALPESKGKNAIIVFVDRLTKYVKFCPTTDEVTGKGWAELFMKHVFQDHGLPEVIISDRDPKLSGHFWQELMRLLGIKHRMSTAYH